MFGSHPSASGEDDFQLLEELQLNQPAEAAKATVSGARDLRVPVEVEPANCSSRQETAWHGQSLRLDPESLTATLPLALLPGDLFTLRVEDPSLGLGTQFVQCRRCRMLTDRSFEVLLQFLSPVPLS